MAGNVVPAVDAFGELLKELFQRAEEVKHTNTVEPPLSKPDLEDILERVETTFFSSAETLELRKQRHAAIDTAIRDKFNDLLVSRHRRNLASLF
jgi:THO complex subunit 1